MPIEKKLFVYDITSLTRVREFQQKKENATGIKTDIHQN